MSSPLLLVAIGVIFLAGLGLDRLGRIVHVPRVTMLILLGALVGPPVLDILPSALSGTSEIYASTALTMVAFLLGGVLKRDILRTHGRAIIIVSLTVVITSVALVAAGLWAFGVPLALALMLGGVSAATDPAATSDVVRQERASGRFATNLLGIVAIDDAWGLLAFSVILTATGMLTDGTSGEAILHGLREAGGAILLGAAIGAPAAILTGRVQEGEPTLIEALGVVFLCAGLAMWLGVSFLLTGMVCGAVVVNFARHHSRPFIEIERIEWPFMLMFFVMAGASLDVAELGHVGTAGALYILFRFVVRIAGGWLGGLLAGVPKVERRLTGLALMPQAGVAIGMALVAGERFPEYAEPLLAVTIASTIFFEVIGPVLTQFALRRVALTERKVSA
jgi:Kef-type K+ transport system membrane component KefB